MTLLPPARAGRWASPSAFSRFPTTPLAGGPFAAAGQGKRKVVYE